MRQQEIEPRRTEIYHRFYDEAVEDFHDEHGYEPTDLETFALVGEAQQRTDAYIKDYINHPPLVRLWEYGLGNLRQQVSAFVAGLGDVLGGKQLPMATHRWYWAPTRIVAELPNQAAGLAILEMPYFTFLYGDLHAHMMAMPVTLLALAWLLAEILGAGRRLRTWWEAGLAVGIGALAVGLLRPTNTWDWIIPAVSASLPTSRGSAQNQSPAVALRHPGGSPVDLPAPAAPAVVGGRGDSVAVRGSCSIVRQMQ